MVITGEVGGLAPTIPTCPAATAVRLIMDRAAVPYPGNCYPTTDRMLQFMWQYRLDAPGMCPGGGLPATHAPPAAATAAAAAKPGAADRGVMRLDLTSARAANRLRPLAGKATARPGKCLR